jgi:hypothetical protein
MPPGGAHTQGHPDLPLCWRINRRSPPFHVLRQDMVSTTATTWYPGGAHTKGHPRLPLCWRLTQAVHTRSRTHACPVLALKQAVPPAFMLHQDMVATSANIHAVLAVHTRTGTHACPLCWRLTQAVPPFHVLHQDMVSTTATPWYSGGAHTQGHRSLPQVLALNQAVHTCSRTHVCPLCWRLIRAVPPCQRGNLPPSGG